MQLRDNPISSERSSRNDSRSGVPRSRHFEAKPVEAVASLSKRMAIPKGCNALAFRHQVKSTADVSPVTTADVRKACSTRGIGSISGSGSRTLPGDRSGRLMRSRVVAVSQGPNVARLLVRQLFPDFLPIKKPSVRPMCAVRVSRVADAYGGIRPATVVKPLRGAEGNGAVSLAEGKAQALPVRSPNVLLLTHARVAQSEPGSSAGPATFLNQIERSAGNVTPSPVRKLRIGAAPKRVYANSAGCPSPMIREGSKEKLRGTGASLSEKPRRDCAVISVALVQQKGTATAKSGYALPSLITVGATNFTV